ncbi:MAG: hypothetical protein IT381_15940 [Deltaproteobacteria bacterium]|nr:hypothetical protein [Deltaproteobacteria bacterium]
MTHIWICYDQHGRVTARVDVGDDGARRDSYLFFYDGGTAQNPAATLANARGKLSHILGPGFSKSFNFSADGRLDEAIVNTLGERALVSKFEYFADGSPMAETVQVIVRADGAAACLDEGMRRDLFLDGLGRVRQVMVHAGASDRDKLRYGSAANPTPLLADVHYDHLGRVGEIALADGTVFKPKYDDHTLARVGFARNVANGGAGAEVSASVRYGKRGRIESEEQVPRLRRWMMTHASCT